MSHDGMLLLTEDLLIGKGAHKTVYLHPSDPSRCVKLLSGRTGIDWAREMRYRKILKKRGGKESTCTMLPKYYGAVETSLGTGHLFERVRDYDNAPSMTLQDFLEQEASSQNPDLRQVEHVLTMLKTSLLKERIVTTNMETGNFMIQRLSSAPGDYAIRVIDNIGTHAKIPIILYVDRLALSHIQRYMERFLVDLRQDYPAIVTDDMAKRIGQIR